MCSIKYDFARYSVVTNFLIIYIYNFLVFKNASNVFFLNKITAVINYRMTVPVSFCEFLIRIMKIEKNSQVLLLAWEQCAILKILILIYIFKIFSSILWRKTIKSRVKYNSKKVFGLKIGSHELPNRVLNFYLIHSIFFLVL